MPSVPSKTQRKLLVVGVVAVAVAVVLAPLFVVEFGGSRQDHVVCAGVGRLGNVSAWFPFAFVAAPFNGSAVSELIIWQNYTVGGVYHNLTSHVPVSVGLGDVAQGWAVGGNWTISSDSNVTVEGSGPSLPCSGPLIASLGPPNGPASEAWGGGIIAYGLKTDVGLPSSFNATQRCAAINASPTCAVSAIFDLNFTRSEGSIDTCGRASATTFNVIGQEIAAAIPFSGNGTTHLVPVGPSSVAGMTGWFNYTFPPNGGIWQYMSLQGIAGGSSGLVFSHVDCP